MSKLFPAISLTGPRQSGKTIMFRKLCPVEIKKTASPDKRLTRTFKVMDKSPLTLGTGAILCMVDKLSAFDKDNLIVPIWMI